MQGFLSSHNVVKYEHQASFAVSTITLLNILLYNYFDSIIFLQIISFAIFTYCSIDLFFCKKDLMIHHILTLGALTFNYMNNVRPDIVYVIFGNMVFTELSTFFYIFRSWMDDYSGPYKNTPIFNIIYTINTVIFCVAFYKLRISNYYYNIIQNPDTYDILYQYTETSILKNIHIYGSIFGLFLLNVYWFTIICKKIYKIIIINNFPTINTTIFAERVLPYTFYLNIYAVFTRYGYNDLFVLDVFGILVLCYVSFIYHGKLAKYYTKTHILNYTSLELIMPYTLDTVAIHMRSCLVVVTHFLISRVSNAPLVIFASAIMHLFGIVCFINRIFTMILTGNNFLDNDQSIEQNFDKNIMYFYIMLPCAFDCFSIVYNTPTIEEKADLFTINIIIAFILYIKPFYKCNHALLHLCLFLQTICLINCNMVI